jgi:glycogen debranching enzyme
LPAVRWRALTRRYHGLLVAALPAPWHRTLLVSKIDEVVEYDGQVYALGANRWTGGAIDPSGHLYIERLAARQNRSKPRKAGRPS